MSRDPDALSNDLVVVSQLHILRTKGGLAIGGSEGLLGTEVSQSQVGLSVSFSHLDSVHVRVLRDPASARGGLREATAALQLVLPHRVLQCSAFGVSSSTTQANASSDILIFSATSMTTEGVWM